jgi:transposase
MTTRIEIVGRVSGRRRWTVEQKLAILRDAFGSDGSVRDACERHGVGSGQIYTWRRQAMSGELTGVQPPALPSFAEVEVAALPVPTMASPEPALPGGQIGIELSSGVRLTVDAAVDADALARVLGVLALPGYSWPAARPICARGSTGWR